jgi:NAD(P)H-nitrite reductase large subunit
VAVCDDDHVCSCNGVSRGAIRCAIRDQELSSVSAIKACTRAGTGCGGCVPALAVILDSELAAAGREVSRSVCEHFAYTRQELFEIVKLGRIASFEQLLESHGRGGGCEVCRPVVASILATTWNDLILKHATIQDTNDRFLANIQRGGTYSVVPRIPGGEITPEKLIAIGEIARRFDLYCKITGGQRIDLLGARVDQLPDIWEALVEAGFESGHAYGKAMRTVKSCVGSTWCRYGVQDSTALAIRIEERYRGLRAPHKLKSAVSGCIRECAEAQSKDFGVIATEQGWNLYVGGNGGAQPRHADLLAADVDEATLIRLIDRFLMYYIQTANPLERTARWLERLDGGLAYLKHVVVDDALGIGAQLEADMQGWSTPTPANGRRWCAIPSAGPSSATSPTVAPPIRASRSCASAASGGRPTGRPHRSPRSCRAITAGCTWRAPSRCRPTAASRSRTPGRRSPSSISPPAASGSLPRRRARTAATPSSPAACSVRRRANRSRLPAAQEDLLAALRLVPERPAAPRPDVSGASRERRRMGAVAGDAGR